MMEHIKSALSDIRQAKYLDSYAVAALAFITACFASLGLASTAVATGVVLVSLSVIAIETLGTKKQVQTIHQTAERVELLVNIQRDGGLQRFADRDYAVHIDQASRVSMITIANYRYLSSNQDCLKRLAERGGTIREVLLDWESEWGSETAVSRNAGAAKRRSHLKDHFNMTLELLHDFWSAVGEDGEVLVRKTPYAPAHVMTWIEFENEPALMFVTPSGFQQAGDDRPTIVLHAQRHESDFRFFVECFENLWSWSESAPIDFATLDLE